MTRKKNYNQRRASISMILNFRQRHCKQKIVLEGAFYLNFLVGQLLFLHISRHKMNQLKNRVVVSCGSESVKAGFLVFFLLIRLQERLIFGLRLNVLKTFECFNLKCS